LSASSAEILKKKSYLCICVFSALSAARIVYMLAAIGIVILYWCVLIIVFCGLGNLLLGVCRFERGEERFFDAFWTGFCIVLFFLQLWHFALPVNQRTLLIVLIFGVAGFVLTARESLADLRKCLNIYSFLSVAALALFVANRAMAPIKLYDAGLYHLAVIQWNSTYAIVPGLGNLMDRFGMNNAYFLYHALLEPFPVLRSFHLANGLLIFLLFLRMLVSFFRAMKREARIADWLLLILLPAAFGQLLDHAEDTSPDFVIFLFGVLIGEKLVDSFFENRKFHAFDIFHIALLTATAVSIKISAIAFGGAASLIVLIRCRSGLRWLVPAVCIFGVWIIGNVLLTGHPLYPSHLFAVNVDWAMPARSVTNLGSWIRISARGPHIHGDPFHLLRGWNWMGEWATSLFETRQNLFEIVVPFCLFVAGIFFARNQERKLLWILAPAILSIVLWFILAPGPRFAGVSFWYLAAAIWAPAFHRARMEPRYLCLLLLSACLVVSRVYYAPVVVRTGPVESYKTRLTHFVTDSGVLLFVPKESSSCWESPLPCTGAPDRKLRLRRDDDLGSGFAADP